MPLKNWFFVTLALSCFQLGASETREPERATGWAEQKSAAAANYMAVTANPYATQAAQQILAKGGSAVDAAISAQLVLTLVEPQSSGIGGGAFMLFYEQGNKQLITYDGREIAPASAKPDMFLKADGKPMRWIDALVGGKAVGVPGVVAMLEQAHQKHGRLPWETLFDYPILLAESGFVVSPRLAKLLAAGFHPGMGKLSSSRGYFFPGGVSLKAGTVKKNPELAETLRLIQRQGAKGFYQGKVAQQIISAIAASEVNPGKMTMQDMSAYQVKQREPLCGAYRAFKVCGMAPPSSGGLAILQMLALLENYPIQALGPNAAQAWHLFAQASSLAFADRAQYVADADFEKVPVQALLHPDYLKQRVALMGPATHFSKKHAGTVPNVGYGQPDTPEFPSTSHLSIVDRFGNAVSMTSSIEMGFGSGLMAGGFLLNNELTDFSLAPSRDGLPVANRVQAGKRPRSSMAPTMVFDSQGQLYLVIGSPGGSRIINYVAQTLVATLDWQMPLDQSIAMPKFTNRNDYSAIEKGTSLESIAPALEALGHKVQIRDLNSGLHGVIRTEQGWFGAADPRREGAPAGG